MAVCKRCANIDLDDAAVRNFYLLGYVRAMVATAKAGCPGCNFIIETANRRGIDMEAKRYFHVMLRRLGTQSHKVDIEDSEEDSDKGEEEFGMGTNEGSGDEDEGSGDEDGEESVDDEDSKEDSPIQLKLCSAYGVERSLNDNVEHEDDQLPPHLVSTHSNDEACFDLTRGWFERYTRSHGAACALKKDTPLPTRLIHVPANSDEPLRLRKTKGMTRQYVALSYVWGTGTTLKTIHETLVSRMKGFNTEELPSSIRDAIHITRRMGFEYL